MRTTITLSDSIYRMAKLRAAAVDTSLSSIVERALINQLLEDAEDLDDIEARLREKPLPFDDLVEKFKAEGLL